MVSRTGIGAGIGIPFRNIASGGGKPYLSPEVKEVLKAVVIAYGKTNNDSDRAIVKNLVDPDNPFVISNAAFKLNSGFGKYEVDFTVYSNQNVLVSPNKIVSIAGREFISLLPYTELSKTISSYKIKVTGLIGELSYWYRNQDGSESRIIITKDGIYQLSTCYNVENGQGSSVGFHGYSESSCTIEQIPSFEGAFVTDGIDDLITSTKTVQEMMGGSNEITVVSLITHISGTGKYNIIGDGGIQVSDYFGQTFMAGTSSSGEKIVELGDKEKLQAVQYTTFDSKLTIGLADSSYAYYGTFVFNKENVPVDWINQVIAYFNLDRTLNPDILCNTIKQGITNENHAEFGDKLIDFSGNGRDIQLNNIAWERNSGIGNYPISFKDYTYRYNRGNAKINNDNFVITSYYSNDNLLEVRTRNKTLPNYKVKIEGTSTIKNGSLRYRIDYISGSTFTHIDILEDGIYDIPATPSAEDDVYCGWCFSYFNQENINVKVTLLATDDTAGALCLDGVNDFGQFVGDLGLKDYTFIMDREYLSLKADQVPVISSINPLTDTPFIFEHCVYENRVARPFSFGKDIVFEEQLASKRLISYQSTYKYNGKDISKGTSVNTGSGLTIGRYGDDRQYANFAFYFLMSFPYSMSEFLIERQLKKHKLGTLYPDMVEFRPIIKANANYNIFYTALLPLTGTVWEKINIGDYVPVGRRVAIQISFDNEADELVSAVSSQLDNITIVKNSNNIGYTIFGYVLKDKSPQKINITIDEYIRYEDIVQPYPVKVYITNKGKIITWGDKLKVGTSLVLLDIDNLLPEFYDVNSSLTVNSITIYKGQSFTLNENRMVFKLNGRPTYKLDNNEPKCILSPNRLRIPNSSYKILGHIPDISGHGNHGKINNSAYAGMSGANGYPNNFNNYTIVSGVTKTDSSIKVEKELSGSGWFLSIPANTAVASMKLNIDGIPSNKTVKWATNVEGIGDITLTNGVNEIPAYTSSSVSGIYAIYSDLTGLSIQQIGEYEGAYCLDGVDDFVTIPTLSRGGKQVLMKVNWESDYGKVLYDQRLYISGLFAIIATSEAPAYETGNGGGKTYIDGILNKNILSKELASITHNITLNNNYTVTNSNIFIGTDYAKMSYAKMALYDFMLFDNISTDDKIKELNEYVGIEAKVELPPYYWDAYGKTNLDADKATIQQRGVAVGDYDLTNNNFAYTEESGYANNGLVYDGVTDYSTNDNIPAFTDYTYIFKRELLSKTAGSASMYKGEFFANGGMAFIADYAIPDGSLYGFSYRGQAKVNSLNTDKIIYGTKTSVNGSSITPNTNIDTAGLTMGKFDSYRKMVFYKLILYPKTIPLLQINFLKNLMERDEIIDLTNPIFIQE